MTRPTQKVSEQTKSRDGWRCLACGAQSALEWQHRQASGHGGRGKRAPVLTPADGITVCTFCNDAFEGEMQDLALRMGWKVRRNTMLTCDQVPVFDKNTHSWWLLNTGGTRTPIGEVAARELIEAAGGYVRKLERRVG